MITCEQILVHVYCMHLDARRQTNMELDVFPFPRGFFQVRVLTLESNLPT